MDTAFRDNDLQLSSHISAIKLRIPAASPPWNIWSTWRFVLIICQLYPLDFTSFFIFPLSFLVGFSAGKELRWK